MLACGDLSSGSFILVSGELLHLKSKSPLHSVFTAEEPLLIWTFEFIYNWGREDFHKKPGMCRWGHGAVYERFPSEIV